MLISGACLTEKREVVLRKHEAVYLQIHLRNLSRVKWLHHFLLFLMTLASLRLPPPPELKYYSKGLYQPFISYEECTACDKTREEEQKRLETY